MVVVALEAGRRATRRHVAVGGYAAEALDARRPAAAHGATTTTATTMVVIVVMMMSVVVAVMMMSVAVAEADEPHVRRRKIPLPAARGAQTDTRRGPRIGTPHAMGHAMAATTRRATATQPHAAATRPHVGGRGGRLGIAPIDARRASATCANPEAMRGGRGDVLRAARRATATVAMCEAEATDTVMVIVIMIMMMIGLLMLLLTTQRPPSPPSLSRRPTCAPTLHVAVTR